MMGRGRSRARPSRGGGGPLGKASRPRAEKQLLQQQDNDGASATVRLQNSRNNVLTGNRFYKIENTKVKDLPARLQQLNSSSTMRLHAGGAAVRGPRNRINFLLLLVCHCQAVRPVPPVPPVQPVHSAQSVQSVQSVQAAGGHRPGARSGGGKGDFCPPQSVPPNGEQQPLAEAGSERPRVYRDQPTGG